MKNFETAIKNTQNIQQGFDIVKKVKHIDLATAPKELVFEIGKIKLYHFANPNKSVKTPVLISYALVNTWKMMDLQEDRSLIRKLLSEGLDVYIMETGYPSRADKYKNLDDYISDEINACVDYILKAHKTDSLNLLGVCQGGTIGLMYSALYPKKIKNIVMLVTPVNFDIQEGLLFKWSKDIKVDAIVDNFDGVVPGKFLDAGFIKLKPTGAIRKQIALPKIMSDEASLMNFLRMERWVDDAPDQAGEIYRQFIIDLYQKNLLQANELKIGERTVNLKDIKCPLLNIYAKEDNIVPPNSTKVLNDLVGSSDKELYEFPGGHIGVFVGARAQKELGPAIAKWLAHRDK